MPSDSRKTLIACIGNLLMRDEALGPLVAKVLIDRETALRYVDEEHADMLQKLFRDDSTFEENIDERIPVLDAGTMGMSMIPYLREYDRIIYIDVMDAGPGTEPGTVFVLKPEDLGGNAVMHSMHDLRLVDVLQNAMLVGIECDVDCICVQSQEVFPDNLSMELTPKVDAAIPFVLGALMELLGIEE